MNIELTGYFDKNYGDDMMHVIIVEHFSEHNFYVNVGEREMLSHLEKYPNVFINEKAPHIDVFLNVTGTGFMYKGKRAKLEKLFSIIRSKQKKYPKSAVINCSIEPFEGRIDEFFAKHDLKVYDLVTCRDESSYKYLSTVKSKVEMHSDIVFSKAHERKNIPENILGIAPVRRLYDSTNYRYYKELARYADIYLQKNGGKALLFAFDSGLENDISAALSVKRMMKNSDSAELVIYNSDVNEFAGKIRECSFFVGSRFHSIVEAYASGIDAIGIYDRKKLELLCDKLSIPSIQKEAFDADLLMDLTENRKLFEKNEKIVADAKGHLECLERFLCE